MKTRVVHFRQSRDFDEVLRDTFTFVRIALKPLLRSIVTIAGPFMVLAAFIYGLFYNNFFSLFANLSAQSNGSLISAGEEYFSLMFVYYPLIVISMIAASVVLTTVVNSFIVCYVESSGELPAVALVLQKTKASFFRMLGTSIVVGILVTVASVFLFFPGLYVGIALLPIFIMRLQENISLSDALSRCLSLIKGHWRKTFGIVIILYLITLLLGYIVAIPQIVVAGLFTVAIAQSSDTSLYSILLTVFSSCTVLVSQLFASFILIGVALQYYNLVERKEAVGLQERIGEMAEPDDTIPPASAI